MEVEYQDNHSALVKYRNEEETTKTQSIASFLYSELLYDACGSYPNYEKFHLSDQPKVVCEATGRLIERLLEKNVLNLDDLKYISGCVWGCKSDSLKLNKN